MHDSTGKHHRGGEREAKSKLKGFFLKAMHFVVHCTRPEKKKEKVKKAGK